MLEKGKISYKQVMSLIIMVVSPTAILYVPTMLYRIAKQDSWISIILVIIVALIISYITISLGLMFKDKTIIQYSEIIMGTVIGKIIALTICIFFIFINTIIIREFAELLAGAFLPETPLYFFVVLILLPSVYAVRNGLEVITRVKAIVFPIFIITIIATLLLVSKDMNFKKILPILSEGSMPVINAAYPQIIWFTEPFVITMFIPYINIPEKVRQKAMISIIILGIIGVITNIGIIVVFGEVTADLIYPFLSIARYVKVGGFIERLDSLIISMWILSVFIKISVFHYCSSIAFAQFFKFRDYRFLVMPIATILSILTIIQWDNIMELTEKMVAKLAPLSIIVQIGFPTIMFLVAKLRKVFIKQ